MDGVSGGLIDAFILKSKIHLVDQLDKTVTSEQTEPSTGIPTYKSALTASVLVRMLIHHSITTLAMGVPCHRATVSSATQRPSPRKSVHMTAAAQKNSASGQSFESNGAMACPAPLFN